MPEKRQIAARRLLRLLVLTPVMVLVSGFAVAQLDGLLAATHPTVRLADRISKEENGAVRGTTLESRTFRAAGRSIAELLATAAAIRERFTIGSWALGLFLGLIVMLRLIRLSVWRSRSRPGADPATCLSCGRCFVACPEKLPRRDLVELEDAA